MLAQTFGDWRAIIVADDFVDYRSVVGDRYGIRDSRLVFTQSGRYGGGPARARNAGLKCSDAPFVTWLDADDYYAPRRLQLLIPLAQQRGIAADLLCWVDESRGLDVHDTYLALNGGGELSIKNFQNVMGTVFPLIRREFAADQDETMPFGFCEDVMANYRLLDRLTTMPVGSEPTYYYVVQPSSMSNDDHASAVYCEVAYPNCIERLEHGDGFGLSPATRAAAVKYCERKGELNRLHVKMRGHSPLLTYHAFIASLGR